MLFKDKQSINGYQWEVKDFDENLALAIYQKNNVPELIARLLALKNIPCNEVKQFLDPKIRDTLKDPYHFLDMQKGVETIYKAIVEKENICIYGDYDVDGTTATSLMVLFFKAIGINVSKYIPDRIDDGYGLNKHSIDILKENNVNLIITVDCGITSNDCIAYALEKNIKTVVTDHHIGHSVLPPAEAVINPNRLDETSEYKYLAGVGVAFMVIIALNTFLRKNNYYKKNNI